MNDQQEFSKILRDMANDIVEKAHRRHHAEVLFERLNLESFTEQELEKEIFKLRLKGEAFSAIFMRRLHKEPSQRILNK